MKISSVYIIIVIFFFACKTTNDEDEIKLKKCVNYEVNKSIKNMYDVESDLKVYDLFFKVEKIIFKKENASKEEYIKVIKNLIYKENLYEEAMTHHLIDSLFFDSKYDYKSSIDSNIIYFDCPLKIMRENKGSNKLLSLQMQMIEEIQEKGYDHKVLERWILKINKKDFNKIVYRTPIILSICNLYTLNVEKSRTR